MGLFDALLGKRKVARAAPDRLFALTTAAIELEARHGIVSAGRGAIVFQQIATGEFAGIVKDMEELVRGTGSETGTTLRTEDDAFGYRWMVFEDPDLDDLVVAANTVNDALQVGGFKDRVLCAMFTFRETSPHPPSSIYWIYNVKRGSWYPFVPAGGPQQRNTERELQLRAMVGAELPVEPELERWFPLWGTPI